ncbi:MAG: nuclear transport factor 2 family protein [Blastocatellia bacterium]
MSTHCLELETIRRVVDLYIEGVRNGNVESLRQAFHPQSSMFGWKGKDLFITPIQGLYDYIASTPAPTKSSEQTKFIITSIQVADNAATVAMAMDAYHAHDFMDYFQLLKVDGRWWIVSKLFHANPQGE